MDGLEPGRGPAADPAMVVAYDDGQRMIAAAKTGGATLDLTLTVDSPYLYDVFQVSKGRVPERIVHTVTAENTAEVTARYGDTGGSEWATEQRFGWRPWQDFSWNEQRLVRTGTTRQEFVSAGDSWWQQRVLHKITWSWGPLLGGLTEQLRRYAADDRVTETWLAPVVRPAVSAVGGAPVPTSAGDTLDLRVAEFVDADGHYRGAGGSEEPDTVEARLSRDGQQVADLSGGWAPVPTTPGAARYRLDLTTRGRRPSGGGPPVPRRPGSSPRPARPGTAPSRCRCCRWTTRCPPTCGARCPAAGRTGWG